MLEKLSKKIGLTETEILVILFLAAFFILGFFYVEFIKNDKADYKYIDYTLQDSLFNYYSNLNPESDADDVQSIENMEIKKRVLELNDTINYVKKDISSLAESSINLNTAGIKDLVKLPGIGEKTAEKIIELRIQRGKFKRVEELMDVKGIGEVKFNKIKKFLYID